MLHEQDSSIDEQTFSRQIWGKARNSVFHGSNYPDPELLTDLNRLTPKLQSTIAAEMANSYGFEHPPAANERDWILHYYTFFGWDTAAVEERFPQDWPRDRIYRLVNEAEPDRWNVVPWNDVRIFGAQHFQNW